MSEILLETVDQGVATLTLNRPDRMNALSAELYNELHAALERLAVDDNVGVVVLTGAGRAFCAGGDVKGMATRAPMTLEQSYTELRRKTESSRLLHEMPKPTIAMVNGTAVGAGFSLALACDMRIVAQSATFSTAFAKVGLSGDFGGSYFLTHLVGPAKARELYFTAETFDAAAALSLGVVNRVLPDAELGASVKDVATRFAAGPRNAFRYMKANLTAAQRGASLSEVLDLEGFGTARARETADYKEAVKAFGEKRKPVFTGR